MVFEVFLYFVSTTHSKTSWAVGPSFLIALWTICIVVRAIEAASVASDTPLASLVQAFPRD